MLDIAFIRENKDVFKEAARKKRITLDLDELIRLDDRRRILISKLEEKKAEQNKVSDTVPLEHDMAKKAFLIETMRALKAQVVEYEEELKPVMGAWRNEMLKVPNIPDISVPEGETDAHNQEVRVWGVKPDFDFIPKDHIELMSNLGMIDLERGTKIAGFRGYILKGDGARLWWAVLQFAVDEIISKGYTFMRVPSLVRKELLIGTGYLPGGEDDLYRTQDDEYLSGTAEVATMGYWMDEVIPTSELPLKYVSISPCFRREAGSHSKDTKGLIRVHEFDKVEQVVLCEASHTTSVELHEEITANAERLLQKLGVPHHVVINCTGDLGLGQVKKYDIESWVPSQNTYRETHSCSYFHDFQTRRLNIKYIDSDGKRRYAHSLNATAVANPRLLVSIVENNQQSDGSIIIPEVLQKYMGKGIIEKNNR